MKKRFLFLTAALMLLIGLPSMWAQTASPGTILWAENWDNGTTSDTPADYLASENHTTIVYGDATISYASTLTTTKLYNETLAGGTAPELLLGKNDTWTITGIPTGGATEMTLSFKENNTKGSISSPTEGITMTLNTEKATRATNTYTILNEGNSTFDIEISASGNTRLDDFELKVKVEVETTPHTITIASGIMNGQVTASADEALEGTLIEITATPNEGYVLETLTYVYGENEPIDITATKSFTMPDYDVTVNATFAEAPEAYFEQVTSDFTDWTGKYLIAYQVNDEKLYALSRVFKAGSNYIGDTTNVIEYLNGGLIEANDNTVAIRVKIQPSENGYSMNLNGNGYLGWLNSNTLVAAETIESSNYEWTIAYVDGNINILNVADNTRILKYNTTSPRFATYSTTSTSTVMDFISLYKYYGPEIVEPTYSITIAEGIENGTIAIENDLTEAEQGTEINIIATPNDGYQIETVTYVYGENEPIDITETLSFTMPNNDVTVNATFKLIPTTLHTITIASGIMNGQVTASADEALEGTLIEITATPNEGYVLETLIYVYGENEPINITATKSFTMPDYDVTVNATFAEAPEAYFEQVTSDITDWTGEYLIAYQVNDEKLYALSRVFKAGSNYIGDTTNVIEYLNGGLIEANDNTVAIRVKIQPSENGYSMNLNGNGYLGWLSGNTLVAAETIESSNYEWTIAYVDGNINILNVADNTRILKYNTTSPRFATYSTTSTSTVMDFVSLYKYYGPEIVETVYSITVAEGIENGTIVPSAYEASAGTNIIVTATADEGYVLEELNYSYDGTTFDVDLGTMTFVMPASDVTISATFVSESEVPAITNEILPIYIQGKDGTNNNRIPYAYQLTISHLNANATYRFVNQMVAEDDNAGYDGVGNQIFASCDNDFIRTTSANLTDEGNYGEFTTDENGEYTGWFISEATGNSRFVPGNHIYMRVRINDGNNGSTAEYKLTTNDYATVLNFGQESDETQGTAFVAKSEQPGKSFVFLYDNVEGEGRPIYGTTVESTGIDYQGISQYATFYQNEVSGNEGIFGGIIPNVNDNGVRHIAIFDNCSGETTTHFESNDGVWDNASTVNPAGGTSDIIFIDLTTLGLDEQDANISIWNRSNEIIITTNTNQHYQMTIYNILGQAMLSSNIDGSGTHITNHNLTKGVYVVNITNNESSFSTKIVVR